MASYVNASDTENLPVSVVKHTGNLQTLAFRKEVDKWVSYQRGVGGMLQLHKMDLSNTVIFIIVTKNFPFEFW